MLEVHWEHYEKFPTTQSPETARTHTWKMHQSKNCHSKPVWFQAWTASVTMSLGWEQAGKLWPRPEIWIAAMLLMPLQNGNASSFTQQSTHTRLLWKQSHWLHLLHISIIFVYWDWLDLYYMIVNYIYYIGFSVLGFQCRTMPLCFAISIGINSTLTLKGDWDVCVWEVRFKIFFRVFLQAGKKNHIWF